MSAWIVSKAHIDALVQEMIAREMIEPNAARVVGYELWEENRRSVAARYPGDGDGEWPGPIGLKIADIAGYQFEGIEAPLHPDAMVHAVHCYNYQSCEHPGWDNSLACRWMEELEASIHKQLGTTLDGWRDNARSHGWPWGIVAIEQVIDYSKMQAGMP